MSEPDLAPSEPAPAVRLRDVAVAAGVSMATASRVLNGSTRQVGSDLERRVRTAAAQLDYSPNAQAQAMVRGAAQTVGLIVHDIADPYFSTIASGVAKAADEMGLMVMLGSTRGRPDQELRYLNAMRAQRGRAAILIGSRLDDREQVKRLASEVTAFERAGGRVVAVSQARLAIDTLVIENRSNAAMMARELHALGYRRFGVLAGPRALLTAKDRYRGFHEGVLQAGAPGPVVAHSDFTRDGGAAAMNQLLDENPDLDCVFAVNDVMAIGALEACRARGVRVPRDVALAGFDDIASLRDVTPSLTTVRLPLERIGAEAMALVAMERSGTPRRRRIGGRLVLRESTPSLH